MPAGVPAPYPQNPFAETSLSREQAVAYLARIKLPASTLDEPASLALLTKVFTAQIEHVPKDTSPLHIANWDDSPDADVVLGSSLQTGMPCGVLSHDLIVRQNKGAFCFSINAVFATLLRSLGFRVSEIVTRCYKNLGENPETHLEGYKWGTFTHELLIADWPASDGDRYIVDGAWGPWACNTPLKLADETIIPGLNSYEAFRLKKEPLPLSPGMPRPIDAIDGYTVSRWVTPVGIKIAYPITKDTPGYWTPFYHALPISVAVLDHSLYHWFSATHDLASFVKFMLVTKVIPNSGGARRSLMYQDKPGMPRRAKVYTTGGEAAQGSEEGRDVEWVDMKVGPFKAFLEKEFEYKFD